MKRIKSACIFQTLIFKQKPEFNYTRELAMKINQQEVDHYKAALEKSNTRYQITDTAVEPDGSIVIRIRKQYNSTADVSEYFE